MNRHIFNLVCLLTAFMAVWLAVGYNLSARMSQRQSTWLLQQVETREYVAAEYGYAHAKLGTSHDDFLQVIVTQFHQPTNSAEMKKRIKEAFNP